MIKRRNSFIVNRYKQRQTEAKLTWALLWVVVIGANLLMLTMLYHAMVISDQMGPY